ncbi:hypothetical protein ACWDSL_47595 [Streptomyces sp. NPDC000941]
MSIRQTQGHQVGHGQLDHGFGAGWQGFVSFSAGPSRPGSVLSNQRTVSSLLVLTDTEVAR